MEKHRFVVNGMEYHYSETELTEYYRQMLPAQFPEDELEKHVKLLIARATKFDGDPYGFLKTSNPSLWRQYHEEEAAGILQIINLNAELEG